MAAPNQGHDADDHRPFAKDGDSKAPPPHAAEDAPPRALPQRRDHGAGVFAELGEGRPRRRDRVELRVRRGDRAGEVHSHQVGKGAKGTQRSRDTTPPLVESTR